MENKSFGKLWKGKRAPIVREVKAKIKKTKLLKQKQKLLKFKQNEFLKFGYIY
jgi:hypothetical protein